MKFSAGGEKFKMKYVLQSLRDWKTWVASAFPFINVMHCTSTTDRYQWGSIWACKLIYFQTLERK